jgi:hypothetical protein
VSFISFVTPVARERIAREFDDRGPEACVAEVITDLRHNNPELLDIVTKCVSTLENSTRVMLGFGMFYRLILCPTVPYSPPVPGSGAVLLHPLPRVTPETRDLIVQQIDEGGVEAFTMTIVEEL